MNHRTPAAGQAGWPTYFETAEPATFDDDSSYVPTDAPSVHTTSHSWNHGLGEIVSALLAEGLTITQLVEHDSVPWDALPGKMDEGADGEYRLREHPERLPLTCTLQAVKK